MGLAASVLASLVGATYGLRGLEHRRRQVADVNFAQARALADRISWAIHRAADEQQRLTLDNIVGQFGPVSRASRSRVWHPLGEECDAVELLNRPAGTRIGIVLRGGKPDSALAHSDAAENSGQVLLSVVEGAWKWIEPAGIQATVGLLVFMGLDERRRSFWRNCLAVVCLMQIAAGIVNPPAMMPVALGVFAWILYVRSRQPAANPGPPRCENCGYNLTGNVSGVCPECGRPLVGNPQLPTRRA